MRKLIPLHRGPVCDSFRLCRIKPMLITILEFKESFWAYVPPQMIREPFDDGRFFRVFSTEQEAADFIFGAWPEEEE